MKWLIINPIVCLSSLTVGYLLGKVNKEKPKIKYVGGLRLDKSEPEEPIKIFLELYTDPEELSDSEYVNLKVIKENYLKGNE